MATHSIVLKYLSVVVVHSLILANAASDDVNQCVNLKRERDFLQYYHQCRCGESYGQFGAADDDGECDTRCDGNHEQMCGGRWRNSVYSIADDYVNCLNEGLFSNGVCECKPGFHGDYCENIDSSSNLRCSGIDLSGSEEDDLSQRCGPVKPMRSISSNDLCNIQQPHAIGTARSLFQKGIDLNFTCDIISSMMGYAVIFPPEACQQVYRDVINPIMNGESISAEKITQLVFNQLRAVSVNVMSDLQSKVSSFSSFLKKTNFCPRLDLNLNSTYFAEKLTGASNLLKTVKNLKEIAPDLIRNFIKTVDNIDCKTYSVVFTLDIQALDVFGLQNGVYVTWNMEEGVKDIGLINGINSDNEDEFISDCEGFRLGKSVAFLMGGKSDWGQKAYILPKNRISKILGSLIPVDLIFSADDQSSSVKTLLGVVMSSSFSVGGCSSISGSQLFVDQLFDTTLPCAYRAAGQIKDMIGVNNDRCQIDFDERFSQLLESSASTLQLFLQKSDELRRCTGLYSCEAQQCVYNFDENTFAACQSSKGQCAAAMEECAKWASECKKEKFVQLKDSCKEQSCRTLQEKADCREHTCRDVSQKTTCRKHECREVTEDVCNKVRDKCGFFNFLCNSFSTVCEKVTSVVCDGPCEAWNYVTEKVCDGACVAWHYTTKKVCDGACVSWNYVTSKVYEHVIVAGECALQGLVEVKRNAKCLEYLPSCASMAGCYITEGTPGALACAEGVITPSQDCLEENGFLN